jgi:hypothetical protein
MTFHNRAELSSRGRVKIVVGVSQHAQRTMSAMEMSAGSAGGGMRELVRDYDWSKTPLGPQQSWPASLRLMIELVLASGFPMAVRWGPEQVSIYNDAYAGILGDKHPGALGRPLREVWPEIVDELGPLSDAILRGERGGYFSPDHLWRIKRHGVTEEARFTLSYSPIPEPSAPNGIGGILATTL